MGLIEFKNVTKQYKNGINVLYDLHFYIEKEEFFFIIIVSCIGKCIIL